MRVLVSGWFSFETAEVTAGDLLARDATVGWLREAGVPHDVAVTTTFRLDGDLDLESLDPGQYSHLLFVCGPAAGKRVEDLFVRFSRCQRLAVDVSVVAGTARLWTDLVLERDGPHYSAPDFSLAATAERTPVVAVVRTHDQPEYGSRLHLNEAHAAIDRLLTSSAVAPVPLDTWLHPGLPQVCSTPGQVESVLSRMDAVVTTRLHGLVLALKVGVPALAVDPVAGMGKVARQAAALGWPAAVCVDDLDDGVLASHLAWCLTSPARDFAATCAERGRARLDSIRAALLAALAVPS